ncbi:hypothetical protein JOQ06_020906, partial [Pogonophryne albipinna]
SYPGFFLEPVLNPGLPGEGAAACPVGHRVSWLDELLDSHHTTYSSISNTRTTQTIGARQSHTTLRTVPGLHSQKLSPSISAATHLPTKIVIISIGINNKDDDPQRNTSKQLSTQTRNILFLNNSLTRHHNTLQPIPQKAFRTGQDHVHWTFPHRPTHPGLLVQRVTFLNTSEPNPAKRINLP